MKLFIVSFFENDGDGSVESNLYGIFDSYEGALDCLKKVVFEEGHEFNKLHVSRPEHLNGALLRMSPRYGDYEIREHELNAIDFNK